jgi:hypothetical protein
MIATKVRPSLATVFTRAAEYTETCDATMAFFESMRQVLHDAGGLKPRRSLIAIGGSTA